jgi:hypothetical protein
MLNRHMIAAILAAILLSATITNDALAAPFQFGDFITYSQDCWGGPPNPGTAAEVLSDNFDTVYAANGLEVGINGTAGFSSVFTSAAAVLDYLPSSGGPGPLNADLVDPTSTSSGIFGGFVIALQLNVDFADAGLLTGSAGIPFGDLILSNMVFNFGDMSALNGLSVRQLVGLVNTQLGGGGGLYSFDDMANVMNELGPAFENGQPTQFAQDHLLVVPAQVPEPATLGLLGIGLATLTARRFNRKRPESPSR